MATFGPPLAACFATIDTDFAADLALIEPERRRSETIFFPSGRSHRSTDRSVLNRKCRTAVYKWRVQSQKVQDNVWMRRRAKCLSAAAECFLLEELKDRRAKKKLLLCFPFFLAMRVQLYVCVSTYVCMYVCLCAVCISVFLLCFFFVVVVWQLSAIGSKYGNGVMKKRNFFLLSFFRRKFSFIYPPPPLLYIEIKWWQKIEAESWPRFFALLPLRKRNLVKLKQHKDWWIKMGGRGIECCWAELSAVQMNAWACIINATAVRHAAV